jgi:hypothetical protein
MFKMLIDTSVWLDLAKDQKQEPVLGVVEEMVKRGLLTIIVPRIVLDEFRDRIAQQSAKSLSTHFRLVKEAVGRLGGDKRKIKAVLSHLDDVNHKIPISDNVGAVKNFLSTLTRALRGARHFALVEALPYPTQGSLAIRCRSGNSVRPSHLFGRNFDHDYFFKLPHEEGAGRLIITTVI